MSEGVGKATCDVGFALTAGNEDFGVCLIVVQVLNLALAVFPIFEDGSAVFAAQTDELVTVEGANGLSLHHGLTRQEVIQLIGLASWRGGHLVLDFR